MDEANLIPLLKSLVDVNEGLKNVIVANQQLQSRSELLVRLETTLGFIKEGMAGLSQGLKDQNEAIAKNKEATDKVLKDHESKISKIVGWGGALAFIASILAHFVFGK